MRWWRDGHNSSTGRCFDIGRTTRAALRLFEQDAVAFAGSEDPRTAGNGSLMRLAPVVLRYRHAPQAAIVRAGDSSRTTHAAPEAIDACRYFAALLLGALNGLEKEQLLDSRTGSPALDGIGPLAPGVGAIAAGSFKGKERREISSSGYVVHTLEAARWAFHHSTTFRDGAVLAVNLAGDADTVGAVYGQLAGAHYGAAGIPTEWLAPLAQRNQIEALADRLLEMAAGTS